MPQDTPADRHRSWRAACAGLFLAAAVLPCAAQSAVTVYGGARGGGEFTDSDTDERYTLDSSAAWSASFDWPLADGRQGQVFYSFQRSALPGEAFAQTGDVDINIHYLHVGGRVFFDGSAATGGGYVVGGLGATFFSPGLSGTSDEVRPSINVGVGYQWQVAPNVALRTELRGYVTLVNSSGGFFCSGGCVVSIQGDALVQAEGMLGLSVGF
jgi:hypothetical protein